MHVRKTVLRAIAVTLPALAMVSAVVALTFQGVFLHRLCGVRAPLWKIDTQRDAAPDLHRTAA